MKKFRVSLAMLRQCNYEIEVEAADEHEAAEKAILDWREGDREGEIVDFDGAETETDFEELDSNFADAVGVDVEEANYGN